MEEMTADSMNATTGLRVGQHGEHVVEVDGPANGLRDRVGQHRKHARPGGPRRGHQPPRLPALGVAAELQQASNEERGKGTRRSSGA